MSDDCGQDGVCAEAPGCSKHWTDRVREAMKEKQAMLEHIERMQELIDSIATIVGTPGDDPGDLDGFEVLRLHVRATVDALQIARDDADEARAEVERLRALLPPSAHTGVRNGPGEGSWAVFAEKVVAERDELRHKLAGEAAHIRSLEGLLVEATRERDEALAALADVSRRCGGYRDSRVDGDGGIVAVVIRERDEARAEVERLRESLRAIAAGFDTITGSVDDPSAKQVDGYFRGYAMAALEKAAQR